MSWLMYAACAGGGRRGNGDASLEGSSESSPGAASGMWAGERRGRGVEWWGGEHMRIC